MFPEERYKYILDKINEKGSVKVEKLVKELSVSSMTIHRDLDELERRGLVIKKYGGGIKPTDLLEEKTNVQKLELNMKERIELRARL